MSKKRKHSKKTAALVEKALEAVQTDPELERAVEDAKALARLSRQPRFEGKGTILGALLRWLRRDVIDVPDYAADSRRRDEALRQVWRKEPRLAGVVNSVQLIDANRGWSLVGGRNQVKRYTDILHAAENNLGWRHFVRKLALSYYTTDMGAIAELGRDGRGGPLRALFHTDSARCRLTGRPDLPLEYHPVAGGAQAWPPDAFFRITSMPSEDEALHGLGWCAVSRVLEVMRVLHAVLCHDQEQLAAKAPRGLLLLQGITQEQWNDAMAQREAELDSKDYQYYGALTILASAGIEQVDAKLVALSQLPVGFDAEKFINLSMYAYALCFGYDPSEFWPVHFAALGRGRETEVQHMKASGKGGLDFCLGLQECLQRELPESLAFEFEQRDDAGELAAVAVQQAKANLLRSLYEAGGQWRDGLFTREQMYELYAEAGLIPPEWTPIEEDVEATDTDDSALDEEEGAPAPPEEPAKEAERWLALPQVQRALELFPREEIVRATWDPRRGMTWRTLWQPRERPRLYPVVKRDQGEVLYESEDLTITGADVERAIDEGRRRVGEEFGQMLDAPVYEEPAAEE